MVATSEELKGSAEYDPTLRETVMVPILRGLMRRRERGAYSRDGARKSFMRLAEAGARKWSKKFAILGEDDWAVIFPKAIRQEVCRQWAEEFETRAANGEYDSLLPG